MFRRTSSFFAIAATAALFVTSYAHAATYEIDPAHSHVSFKVRHLGISNVSGEFLKFQGSFNFDEKDMKSSSVEASIDVPSIDTNIAKRDTHLKSCDFFCTDQFPTMTFKSKKVEPGSGKEFKIVGDLTLHGVTKEVVLDAEHTGSMSDPKLGERAAFSATTALNRKDFGLKWNNLTETGGIVVGDEVKVTLEIEGIKKKSA